MANSTDNIYIGMPLYLDDSIFRLADEEIQAICRPSCPISGCKPESDNRPESGNRPNTGNRPNDGDKNENYDKPGNSNSGSGNSGNGNSGNGENSKECNTEHLAIASVPWQKWCTPYNLEESFNAGTIFPGLNLPFGGGRCI